MRGWAHRVRTSLVFYPMTVFFLSSVAMMVAVSQRVIRLDVGILSLLALAILLVQASMLHEVAKVHELVNSQRDLLLERIDQLEAALAAANVRIPEEGE